MSFVETARLHLLVGGFMLTGAVIAFAGTRLSGLADEIAERTGAGEALTGALLLGATTSLPGIVASVTAALDGRADLAISNAIGGIAAQTAFLGIADASTARPTWSTLRPRCPTSSRRPC